MNNLLTCSLVVSTLLVSGSLVADEEFAMRSDSTVVTVEDIERYITENVPSDEPRRSQLLAKSGFFHELAESLVVLRTLSKEAINSGLIDMEQAEWEAEHVRQRKLVEMYRKAYLRDVFRDTDWDSLAKESYLAEPERYRQQEQVSAAHILVTTNGRTDEEALERISSIRAQLADGEEFAALAQQYSEDPSAQRNKGSLGFFPKGKMDPSFGTAAFALENVGDLSEPVKSQFGYHLIKLEGKRDSKILPFEDVKETIIGTLKNKWTNELWQDKVIAARSDKSIVLNDEAFDSLSEKHSPKPEEAP